MAEASRAQAEARAEGLSAALAAHEDQREAAEIAEARHEQLTVALRALEARVTEQSETMQDLSADNEFLRRKLEAEGPSGRGGVAGDEPKRPQPPKASGADASLARLQETNAMYRAKAADLEALVGQLREQLAAAEEAAKRQEARAETLSAALAMQSLQKQQQMAEGPRGFEAAAPSAAAPRPSSKAPPSWDRRTNTAAGGTPGGGTPSATRRSASERSMGGASASPAQPSAAGRAPSKMAPAAATRPQQPSGKPYNPDDFSEGMYDSDEEGILEDHRQGPAGALARGSDDEAGVFRVPRLKPTMGAPKSIVHAAPGKPPASAGGAARAASASMGRR